MRCEICREQFSSTSVHKFERPKAVPPEVDERGRILSQEVEVIHACVSCGLSWTRQRPSDS